MRITMNLLCMMLAVSIWHTSALDNEPMKMSRRFISASFGADLNDSGNVAPPYKGHRWNQVLPSAGPNDLELPLVDPSLLKRSISYEGERELDSLGGTNLYHLPYNRYVRGTEDADNNGNQYSDEDQPSHLKKRALDTLGDRQIHEFKRRFGSLGGSNLHSGYKRFLSSLGGSQIHDFKRFDSLGGSNLHAYKRFISSLGGNNIYDYKRTLSNLGGGNLHGGYNKRYLSSLGGGNIYDYKRSMDTLGGNNLHAGYKRFISSLGGTNIHSGGYKRTLSSLGGMNLHDGYKRALSSLGGSEIFGYKRDVDEDVYDELEKRKLDTLGGLDVHRYKRSDANHSKDTLTDKASV